MLAQKFLAVSCLAFAVLTACEPAPVDPVYKAPPLNMQVNFNISAQDYTAPEWDSLEVKIHLGIGKYTMGVKDEALYDSVLAWRPVREIPSTGEAIQIQKNIRGLDQNKHSVAYGYVIYLRGKVNSRPYTRTYAEGTTRKYDNDTINLDVHF